MDWPHLSFSHNADVQVIIIFLFGKGKVKSLDRSSGTPITSAFLGTSHGFAIYEPGWKERRLDDRNTLIMVVRSSEKRRPFHNGITVLPLLPQLLFSAMHSEKDETFLAHFIPLWHCFLYQSANAVSKMNLTLLASVSNRKKWLFFNEYLSVSSVTKSRDDEGENR